MATDDQIEARAEILETLAHGSYRARLANGHVCMARTLKKDVSTFCIGDAVRLAFHPADLSRARILGPVEESR